MSWTVPRSSNGPLKFDVRDFGVDPTTVSDCQPGIQAAHDAAYAAMGATAAQRATIYMPSGNYRTHRPIFLDRPGIELIGENWGTQINPNSDFPAVVIGVERTLRVSPGHVLDATYRPDAFGVVDSGAASGSGIKHGFRTQTNAFLGFQQTGFDSGFPDLTTKRVDRFAKTNQLTLDFILTPGDLTQTTISPNIGGLCGMGQAVKESPFLITLAPDAVNAGNTSVHVNFRTSDFPDWSTGSTQTFRFLLCGSAGGVTNVPPPWRVSIQFDLLNGVYAAWVNKVQMALTGTSLPAAGKFFKINYLAPFTFFTSGSLQLPAPGVGGFADLGCYGLHMSNTVRYLVSTTGTAPVRVDSLTITDTRTYFTPDAHTMGLLPMTDVASGEAVKLAYRCVPVKCTTAAFNQTAMGFFLSWGVGDGQQFNRIANLQINGPNSGGNLLYGNGILIGAVLETKVENCLISSNGYAAGTMNWIANYTINFDQCHFHGGDSCVYSWSQASTFTNCRFLQAGNFTVKMGGCNAQFTNSFFGDYDNSTYCVWAFLGGAYDSQYYIDNFFIDSESGGFARAMILCQRQGSVSTRLTVKNGEPIFTSPGVMLELQDSGSSGQVFPRAFVHVSNVSNSGPVVSLDGPGWYGELEGFGMSVQPRITHSGVWGTGCNVRLIDHQEARWSGQSNNPIVGPPTDGTWYVGAHQYFTSSPQPGQAVEWRCITSGTLGGSPQPKFAPASLMPAPAGVGAGYSTTGESMTVTLTA